MIVKKMPDLKGFPKSENMKKLSENRRVNVLSAPLFYDIETTGLSRNSSFCYLIGAAVYEDDNWQMYQWFADGEEEEREILKAFSEFMEPFTCTIQYNGNQFDQPFLEARLKRYELPDPFAGKASLDLYQELKPLKGLLKLSGMKQPQLEKFLKNGERRFCDGGECTRVYRKYVSSRDGNLCQIVLGHNQEDLIGLGKIFQMISYLCLWDGEYDIVRTEFDGERLIFTLTPYSEFPVEFSNGTEDFYITGGGKQIRLAVRTTAGKVRQYYENYRDYYYLPQEDTIVPKSLGAYMDKSLRTPAKRETCYTWFDCTGDFLNQPEKQKQYLQHTLPYLLGTLK